MLVDQHSSNPHTNSLRQSHPDEADNISGPWLNRYRSYEDMYRLQKAVAPETLCQEKRRAIVIGRAGVGKSTFCRYGLYRWSLRFQPDLTETAQALSPWWTQYDLVFWIPLRILLNYLPKINANSEEIDESDLATLIIYALKLQREINDEDVCCFSKEALIQTLQNKALNILYLLDGFDEAERLQYQDAVGAKLLEYLLRKKNYVLTTRPHVLQSIIEHQPSNAAYYELMGFANDDIPHYVKRAFQLNQRPVEESEQLLQRLETNMTMWTAAHTPIQLALLCALWKDDLIPQNKTLTMTNLYTILLERLLGYNIQQLLTTSPLKEHEKRNLLNKYKIRKVLADFIKPLYAFLSKIAFISLRQNTLLIREEFLLEQLDPQDFAPLKQVLRTVGYTADMQASETTADLLPWLGRLGILHAIPLGERYEYEFIHLTFQEYLAAYYLTEKFISESAIPQQEKTSIPATVETLLPDLVNKPEWQMILSFMAGLLYANPALHSRQKLTTYMALLAHVPDKRCHCTSLLIDDPKLMPKDMIRRTLLLAYSLEECELAAMAEKPMILEAIKACGKRALLFPRDFPDYSQERLSIVHALKLCPKVFAASGLLEWLESPEKHGILLSETLYLAQAALLQITQRNTLAGLTLLLQKARDSDLVTVQLQLIEDILQWSHTYTAGEEAVMALGLCLCSQHSNVVEKAQASLAELHIANKQSVLNKVFISNLSSKDPHVKMKAALGALQSDFYHHEAWCGLMEALSSQHASFLKEVDFIATDFKNIMTFNKTETIQLAGKVFAWILIHDTLTNREIILSMVKSISGLTAVIQTYLIARLTGEEYTYIKRRMIKIVEELYHFDNHLIQILIALLSDLDELVINDSVELLEKLGKTDLPGVLQKYIQNLGHPLISVRASARATLEKLKKIDAPETIHACVDNLENKDPDIKREAADILLQCHQAYDKVLETLIQNLGNSMSSVRNWAFEWLKKLGKQDIVITTHIQNLSALNAAVRQSAARALRIIGKHDAPKVIEAHQQNLSHLIPEIRQEAAEALIELHKADSHVIKALGINLSDGNVVTRESATAALKKLEKHDTPEVIEAHRQNLSHSDEYVRQRAAAALEKMGKLHVPEVIKVYQQNLNHRDVDIRLEAAEALFQLGKVDDLLIEALLRNNLSASRADVRRRAAEALKKLELHDAPSVIKAYQQNLYHRDVDILLEAAEALIQLSKVDGLVIEALYNNLSASTSDVRQRAAENLIPLGKADDRVIEALLRNNPSTSSSVDVRRRAAKALKKLELHDAPNVIKAYQQNLNHRDVDIRLEAAEALFQLGKVDDLVIETLLRDILGASRADVRRRAAEALKKLELHDAPSVIKVYQQNLYHDNDDICLEAAEALIQLGKADDRVIEALLCNNLITSSSVDVRRRAAEALKKLELHDAPSIIKAYQQNLNHRDVDIRLEAAEALIQLGKADDSVTKALHNNLSASSADVRRRAAEALKKLELHDAPSVIKIYQQNLRHGEVDIRLEAAEALIQLGKVDDSVTKALHNNLSASSADVRRRAAEALKKASAPKHSTRSNQNDNFSSIQNFQSKNESPLQSNPSTFFQSDQLDQETIQENFKKFEKQKKLGLSNKNDSFDDDLLLSYLEIEELEEEFSEEEKDDKDSDSMEY